MYFICFNKKLYIILKIRILEWHSKNQKLLSQNIHDKTIVFTGAMIPYKFGASDGLFNLGSALTAVQTLSSGVYIAINGNIFKWDKVKKNRKEGIFESIN